MPVSPAEAQAALRDISQAEQASAKIYRYRHASPHLFLWGIIWALGYGACYADPQWGEFWPALALLGTIASFWIGWKTKPEQPSRYDWRYVATALAVLASIGAIFAVMPPQNSAQLGAFFPILVALLYALIGIWSRGARLVITAIAVAALTLAGYFFLPQYFMLWMAAVGGGALILGGAWLRSV
jgi:hypothetical protein